MRTEDLKRYEEARQAEVKLGDLVFVYSLNERGTVVSIDDNVDAPVDTIYVDAPVDTIYTIRLKDGRVVQHTMYGFNRVPQ